MKTRCSDHILCHIYEETMTILLLFYTCCENRIFPPILPTKILWQQIKIIQNQPTYHTLFGHVTGNKYDCFLGLRDVTAANLLNHDYDLQL